MSPRPLAIDLFCGLGGWTEGFLAEGWRVVGFDIEQHVYGEHRYPAQLVLQDVRTLHGSQFKDADMIVASSPCQEFSYRAMPWKRAKALGPPELGMELFAQAARIQAEAIAAAGGRFIPMIQENVKGAQKYVGRARWHYGSYYLWGDVPALMPTTTRRKSTGGSWFTDGNGSTVVRNDPRDESTKRPGHDWNRFSKTGEVSPHWRMDGQSERTTKNDGGSWFNVAHNEGSGHSKNPVHGTKGDGGSWFGGTFAERKERWPDSQITTGSKSSARKAASARIAKIPLPLASHIARTFYPHRAVETPDGAA